MNIISSSNVHYGFNVGDLLANTVNFVSSNGQFILLYVAVIVGGVIIGYIKDVVDPPKKARKRSGNTSRNTSGKTSKVPSTKYEYSYHDGVRWRASGTYKEKNRKLEYYNRYHTEWRPREDFYKVSSRRR